MLVRLLTLFGFGYYARLIYFLFVVSNVKEAIQISVYLLFILINI